MTPARGFGLSNVAKLPLEAVPSADLEQTSLKRGRRVANRGTEVLLNGQHGRAVRHVEDFHDRLERLTLRQVEVLLETQVELAPPRQEVETRRLQRQRHAGRAATN